MGYVSAVYFSSWSIYQSNHFVHQLQSRLLTHVFYAFIKICPHTGGCYLADPWADVQMPMFSGLKGSLAVLKAMKERQRNMKTIMSIGGWGAENEFRQMMRTPETLAEFVRTAMGLVKEHKFDGVDVDWEFVRNNDEAVRLVHLLARIREGLQEIYDFPILTAAMPAADEHIDKLLLKDMCFYLTFMNVMCYDFCGEGWSERTGYHLNLYGSNGDNKLCADRVVSKYISLGVPPNQIVLGMPMYGRTFKHPKAIHPGTPFERRPTSAEDTIDFRNIDRSLEIFDERRVAAYVYDEKNDLLITYDSPQCVAMKAHYVKEKGLRGGFFWDSKGDSDLSELLSTFVGELNGELEWQENNL